MRRLQASRESSGRCTVGDLRDSSITTLQAVTPMLPPLRRSSRTSNRSSPATGSIKSLTSALGLGNDEAFRALSSLMNFPHGFVSLFEIATQAARVEQWVSASIGLEFASDRSQQVAVSRESQRQPLVLLQALGNKLGQSGGSQHACSHSAGERIASTGQHRQPGARNRSADNS